MWKVVSNEYEKLRSYYFGNNEIVKIKSCFGG